MKIKEDDDNRINFVSIKSGHRISELLDIKILNALNVQKSLILSKNILENFLSTVFYQYSIRPNFRPKRNDQMLRLHNYTTFSAF